MRREGRGFGFLQKHFQTDGQGSLDVRTGQSLASLLCSIQKRCHGFISFLSTVCTRPARQRRGEAVDQCDNIHANTMTTGVWTWSRDSPMPFFGLGGKKSDLRSNKMGWHGMSRWWVNCSWLTWQWEGPTFYPCSALCSSRQILQWISFEQWISSNTDL